MKQRINFFIAGESGMGIVSSGEILLDALAEMGYRVTADREFPSLIKGGQAAFKVSFASERVRGGNNEFHLGICMGKSGITYGLEHLEEGSVLVHDFARREERDPHFVSKANDQGIEVVYVPTRDIIHDLGVHTLFENTIVIGTAAHLMGLDLDATHHALKQTYGHITALREMNVTCLERGYALVERPHISLPELHDRYDGERMIIDGNTALALGALNAGVRNYYAYPMSPASSILSYFAKTAEQTGAVVKQAEDEITAIQMNIGSMYAGARALTATSGGGFDLMTESISLAGMLEVPTVVVIAQRPGPATGLATWTAQSDLDLAINAGHGEFSRIVVACSDQVSAFHLIQKAYTYAEQYQVPVVFLTEKVIAENRQTIPRLEPETDLLDRGVVTDPDQLAKLQSSDRYKITETGVSTRRLPGSSETTYFCNGDEHKADGSIDESPECAKMVDKRLRKLKTIKEHLPEPTIYGPRSEADISFIGRGSTKNPMLDLIAEYKDDDITINYLHIDWLWPLKTDLIEQFLNENTHICIAENNATGQLAQLLHQQLCIHLPHQLLKYNGRQIVREDIKAYITDHLSS